MAGLAWLTVRQRPSEPRLVCDLSLLHRLPIGADSGQIGSVWPLAQGGGSGCCSGCRLAEQTQSIQCVRSKPR